MNSLSIHKRWLLFFTMWILFLSGIFANFLGSPGIFQELRLNNLLMTKRAQLTTAEEELKKLQAETAQLEKNPFAQEREIRRVLGYAASDEIIFDLSHL